MSEYHVVKTQYKQEDCLLKSLQELGYKVDVHQSPQSLRGYRGDLRQQKAHLIIKKEHIGSASNDVGFFRNADGQYQMIISAYDKGVKKCQPLLKSLSAIYNKHVVLKTAALKGCSLISQTTDAQGRIHMRFSK